MKICKIWIKGYQQFQDTFLDFTHPETGEPLDKICLIGSNGTGKTTLLEVIRLFLSNRQVAYGKTSVIKIEIDKKYYYILYISQTQTNLIFFSDDIESNKEDFNILFNYPRIANRDWIGLEEKYSPWKYSEQIYRKILESQPIIYAPAESASNVLLTVNDVPNATVNEALNLFDKIKREHIISNGTVSQFWNLLIYHIKKRDEEREAFENAPENINKTKRQLIDEFEQINPKILDKLATIWNRILAQAGLEFDADGASNPIQLTDNLKAYIKVKGTNQTISYNALSTGIRNFMFRIGHIFALYFNRSVENGFLLVDEPENSLFPDFLYDLIDVYRDVTTDKNSVQNTQAFFATHNPIIAAQFEPYERIILDWDRQGSVVARKGSAPLGDDPNDVLKQDFEVQNLMGRGGIEMWNRYLNLRKKLRKTEDQQKKDALISEITQIGTLYNFES